MVIVVPAYDLRSHLEVNKVRLSTKGDTQRTYKLLCVEYILVFNQLSAELCVAWNCYGFEQWM